MAKKFQLQIPEPCHEDWNKMTPGDKGRFCDSCQKAVHDFTGMSDAQLIAFFKKPSTGSVCGRFLDDQLDRDFEIPRKRIPWVKYFFQFTIPVFLTGLKAQSQLNLPLKERTCSPTITNEKPLAAWAGTVTLFTGSKKILGRVVDEKGNGIPYASVYIKTTKEGTTCDSSGLFELDMVKTEKKISLLVSSIGFSTTEKELNLKKDKYAEIVLNTIAVCNKEVVVTAMGLIRKGRTTLGYTTTVVNGSTTVVKEKTYLQKVRDFFANDSIKVFPNPAKAGSDIKIVFKKVETGEYNADLYNLQGQLIRTSLIKTEAETVTYSFHIPNVIPGSYILRLTSKNSAGRYTGKIIIQ